jgi:hypothetical protein
MDGHRIAQESVVHLSTTAVERFARAVENFTDAVIRMQLLLDSSLGILGEQERRRFSSCSTGDGDQLWSTDELAAFLSITPRAVRAMRGRAGIPSSCCCKVGGRVRYIPREVRLWIGLNHPSGGRGGPASAGVVPPNMPRER